MAALLARLGRACARRRWPVLIVWVLLLAGAGTGAVTLAGSTTSTFSIPGTESTRALDVLAEQFPQQAAGNGSARVVVQAPVGEEITTTQNAAAVTQAVQALQGLPEVAGVANPLDPQSPAVSPDRRAALISVRYTVPATAVTDAARSALMHEADSIRASGLTAEVGGDAATPPTEVGGIGEVIGVAAALVVLLVTYGSVVAAGLNLLTALVGVAIGAAGITALTGFVSLQNTTPLLAVMLGLAVGIDYALLMVNRYRQELRAGRDPDDAVGVATGTAGSAVTFAGLTVVIALAGLSVVGIPFLTSMGLAAAATVVIAVAVALTLVPAVLGFAGVRVLRRRDRAAARARATGDPVPYGRRHLAVHRSGRAGRAITRHPLPVLIGAVAALVVVALPVFSLRTSLPDDATAAPATTQRRAYDLIGSEFGPGVNGPLLLLVEGSGAAGDATTVARRIPALGDVALVTPPQPAASGDAALLTVIPASGPQDQATTDLVNRIRDRIEPGVSSQVSVTGQTAVQIDVTRKLSDALPVYLAIVVGLALVVLLLVFRSVLVPVVAALGFLLTIGVSLGATTAVFQWGWLSGVFGVAQPAPLISLAPVIVVGILFGLAMDYQVFLVSRIREAHVHGADTREAVRHGYASAGIVVAAAATIMTAVFAGFVTSGDQTLKSIAFALAVGVLADAFVVRMLVVPTVLSLLGEAAWWLPRWLGRVVPHVDVEGADLPGDEPAPGPTDGRRRVASPAAG